MRPCFTVWQDEKKKKKSKKEPPEITQVLDLPKDPPQAIVAQTERLVFHVSPLSAKGLLSQQIKDAIKGLWTAAKGAQIVKIRAFVAGSGDMRRVPAIVSDMFSERRQALPAVSVVQVGTLPERRQALPAVSVVQVGTLPMDGAQVVLESIAVDKKVVNPNGLAFVSGQVAKVDDAVTPLKAALGDLEPRAITCFLAALDKVADVRTQISTAYPRAVANYVQLRRDTIGDFIECEAIAAPPKSPAQTVEFRNPVAGRYSNVAIVPPGKVVISGTQLAFGTREEDLRLAFGRLEKALGSVGGKLSDAIITRMYPLSSATAEAARKIRFEFYDAKQPPASTLLVFEGLPSLDASFGVEVVALAR
jgi:enamine deaminase RidA (YjgF/YER057c/UK114 family)